VFIGTTSIFSVELKRTSEDRLDEGAQVTRGAVLAVQDHADIAVIVDRHAAAKIICCCHMLY
jgi:hypothetical protein